MTGAEVHGQGGLETAVLNRDPAIVVTKRSLDHDENAYRGKSDRESGPLSFSWRRLAEEVSIVRRAFAAGAGPGVDGVIDGG